MPLTDYLWFRPTWGNKAHALWAGHKDWYAQTECRLETGAGWQQVTTKEVPPEADICKNCLRAIGEE